MFFEKLSDDMTGLAECAKKACKNLLTKFGTKTIIERSTARTEESKPAASARDVWAQTATQTRTNPTEVPSRAAQVNIQ